MEQKKKKNVYDTASRAFWSAAFESCVIIVISSFCFLISEKNDPWEDLFVRPIQKVMLICFLKNQSYLN